jgi:DNA replication and repair protein RecF
VRVVRLATASFRNLDGGELHTDARFVVLSGENGQGKTNLLEAVWTLATLRPLRGHRIKELSAWGADHADVAAVVRSADGPRRLRLHLGARRELVIDGEPTADLAGWFKLLRAIAFTPQDAAIVTDEPERRRAWIDRAAFTAWPGHLDLVRVWQRALAHKAAALRLPRPDADVLDALDTQLARLGAEVATRRERLLDELRPHVDAMHRALTGGAGRLELQVVSPLAGQPLDARVEGYLRALARARPEELRRRTSLVGPQRDDLRLLLDGQPLRTFGSRGQVRTLVLALKLAELLAAHARGDRPLFLLDDLSSELDRARTGRLVGVLSELDAQVWVTTTDPDHLGRLPEGEVVRVVLQGGKAVLGGS